MNRIINIKYLAAFVLVSALSIACSREVIPSGEERGLLTFNASLDINSTKTYLDGVQVKWEAADSVSLWYGTLNTAMNQSDYFVGSIGDDARQATLKGSALSSSDYMAVYPLSASKDCSKKGKLTVELPMKQDLRAGSFASKANVSVAYSNTTNLSFKNVGGLLALKVSSTGGHTIKKIRLTGTGAMAGEVEIKQATVAAGEPSVDAFVESVNFITLDCDEGIVDNSVLGGSNEDFSSNGGEWNNTKSSITKSTYYSGDNVYYMVALPGIHTSFALTFVDSDGKTAVAKSSYGFTIDRNSNTLIADISLSDDKFKKDKEIYINEIFCHEDKIELYNAENKEVDLTGYYFTKDDEKYWAIPSGTTVPAKGYIVFTAGQSDCTLGPTWGISGDKGFELKLSNGKKVDKIDNTGDDKLIVGETETMGRKTDGEDEWVVFSTGTIYENGVCDGDNSKGIVKVATAGVVINEINGNDKYLELYNSGAEAADITGWQLFKDGSSSPIWTASDASQCTLAAGAYLAIDFVKKSTDPTQAASGLSAGKSLKIELKNSEGVSVDVFTRGEESTGWGNIDLAVNSEASFSRVPNGGGEWKYAAPTKGAANGVKTGIIEQYPAANGVVVLNELDGNNKFIELYNTSTDNKISLEEVTIYKDDGASPIWTGSQGLCIAPGGFLLIYSEDVKGSHLEHDAKLFFSSGLSPKKTLKIEIKSADGSSSLDTYTRGSAPWGTTISSCSNAFGRVPDGTGDWKLIEFTPGTANGTSKGDIPQS